MMDGNCGGADNSGDGGEGEWSEENGDGGDDNDNASGDDVGGYEDRGCGCMSMG